MAARLRREVGFAHRTKLLRNFYQLTLVSGVRMEGGLRPRLRRTYTRASAYMG